MNHSSDSGGCGGTKDTGRSGSMFYHGRQQQQEKPGQRNGNKKRGSHTIGKQSGVVTHLILMVTHMTDYNENLLYRRMGCDNLVAITDTSCRD